MGWRDRRPEDYGAVDGAPDRPWDSWMRWGFAASALLNLGLLLTISGYAGLNSDATSEIDRLEDRAAALSTDLETVISELEATKTERDRLGVQNMLAEQRIEDLERILANRP